MLRLNDYPPERARVCAWNTKEMKVGERREWTSVLKLPFVSDVLARDVSRIVHQSRLNVRVVFSSGLSLEDMLVTSRFGVKMGPREVRKE